MTSSLPTELVLLGWSVVLLVAHIQIQGVTVTRERGSKWNLSARDDAMPDLGQTAARAQRALDNYKETWPAFIALALSLAVTERVGGIGTAGAVLWFVARLIYLPLYLLGVPYWRTVVFVASLVGLMMMLFRFL